VNSALSSGNGELRLMFGWVALWIAAVAVCGAAWFYSSAIVWSVVTPLIACTIIIVAFLIYIRRIEGTISYFEIGVFCAIITFLYSAYPLVRYILGGYSFPEWGDGRLFMLRLRPDDLGSLVWWYALYLSCFCAGYALTRGRTALRSVQVEPADAATVITIAVLLTCTKLFFFVLGWFFNLRTSSYFDEYLVMQRLPLLVRQVAAHVQGIDLTLQMMLVVALASSRRKSFRIMLVVLLLYVTVTQLLWPGARVKLFAVILAMLAVVDLTIRRIPLRWMLAGATAGFVILLTMSAMRDPTQSGPRLPKLATQVTEFEIIFGNAVDLKYIKEVSGAFIDKPGLYWSGLTALIPSEFLTFEKDTPSDWYGRQYYRQFIEAGGGLAFGVLAEAVVGYGAIEMVWRGLLVGLAFGLLHRRLMRGRVSLPFMMFYVWIVVWCYQTVRNITLGLLVLILYHVIAPLLATLILSAVLRRGRRAARQLASVRQRRFV
jgi:hypothetical protein